MISVLFICSRNQWRSPTAETIWRKDPRVNARSAGVSKSARRKVSAKDIHWADIICVMEHTHKSRMTSDFRQALVGKRMEVLDIPDDYTYMDLDLIDMLTVKVEAIINEL